MAVAMSKVNASLLPGKTNGMKGVLNPKRKLDFPVEVLKGRAFYLDLVGLDALTAEYQKELTLRGAVVSQFFDKTVDVLVFRKEKRKSGSPGGNASPSGNRPSPYSNSSASNMMLQRGMKALELAIKKTKSSKAKVDLKKKAEMWGIEVWSTKRLDDCLAMTKDQIVLERIRKVNGYGKAQPGSHKIRALKEPFVKVEDVNRIYKPLVLEMKAWPKANDSCSPEESPFDTPRRMRHHTAKAKKSATAVAKKAQKALPEKRSGYCECCKSYFNDILLHLSGEQHLAFAANIKNYESLDEIISQGTSFEAFLKKYARKSSPKVTPKKPCSEATPGFSTPSVATPVTPYITRSVVRESEALERMTPGVKRNHQSSSDDVIPFTKKPKFRLSSSPIKTPPTPVKNSIIPDKYSKSSKTLSLSLERMSDSPRTLTEKHIAFVPGYGTVVTDTPSKTPQKAGPQLEGLFAERDSPLIIRIPITTPQCGSGMSYKVQSTASKTSSRRSLRQLARKLNKKQSPDEFWKSAQHDVMTRVAKRQSPRFYSPIPSTQSTETCSSVLSTPKSGPGPVTPIRTRRQPKRQCRQKLYTKY